MLNRILFAIVVAMFAFLLITVPTDVRSAPTAGDTGKTMYSALIKACLPEQRNCPIYYDNLGPYSTEAACEARTAEMTPQVGEIYGNLQGLPVGSEVRIWTHCEPKYEEGDKS